MAMLNNQRVVDFTSPFTTQLLSNLPVSLPTACTARGEAGQCLVMDFSGNELAGGIPTIGKP